MPRITNALLALLALLFFPVAASADCHSRKMTFTSEQTGIKANTGIAIAEMIGGNAVTLLLTNSGPNGLRVLRGGKDRPDDTLGVGVSLLLESPTPVKVRFGNPDQSATIEVIFCLPK